MTFTEELQTGAATGNNNSSGGSIEILGTQVPIAVVGAFLAIVGLAGAGALWWFKGKPAWETHTALLATLDQKNQELVQKKAQGAEQKLVQLTQDFDKEQRISKEIVNVYAQENTMKTFLIDLNRVFMSNNIQLFTYKPVTPTPVMVADGSLGAAANGKLMVQDVDVTFDNATYGQIEGLLQNIDRLQPLISLRDLKTTVVEKPTYLYDKGKMVTKGETKLSATFKIRVLVVPSPETLAEAAAAAAAAAAPPPPPAQ